MTDHRPPTPAPRAPAGYCPAALGLAQGLGRLVFGAALELTVHGRELVPADGPVILAGNHSGFLDGPLVVVAAPRRARALTKSELYRGSLGAALELIGQIPVRRELPDRAALDACLGELTRGGAIASSRKVPGGPAISLACTGVSAGWRSGPGRRSSRWPASAPPPRCRPAAGVPTCGCR